MLHTAYIDVARIPGKLTFTTTLVHSSWLDDNFGARKIPTCCSSVHHFARKKNGNFPMAFPWDFNHQLPAEICGTCSGNKKCFDHGVFLHIFIHFPSG